MDLKLFTEKKCALDYDLSDWESWTLEKGFKKHIAKQIYSWLFQKQVIDPSLFSNLSLETRNLLKEEFDFSPFTIDSHLISVDQSQKVLLKTKDHLLLEMVIMPYEERVTLCISSQVGCKMGCTFCQTGKMGFKRNLTSGEILSQIIIGNQLLKEKKTTNIVFMGMGEPLDNYDNVIKACKAMIDEEGFALSKSRVTISTAGLVPMIERLGQDLPVRLAISLHSADQTLRSKMMPINRTYDLDTLKKALLAYPAPPRHGITFEYVMIENVNDSILDAKKLVKFVHGLKAKVNLIPVNQFPGMPMNASTQERIKEFQTYLSDRSIPAPVRYSRGQDISGGCGQLAAKRKEELNLDPRILHRTRRK